jgi:hypothetical protein
MLLPATCTEQIKHASKPRRAKKIQALQAVCTMAVAVAMLRGHNGPLRSRPLN